MGTSYLTGKKDDDMDPYERQFLNIKGAFNISEKNYQDKFYGEVMLLRMKAKD